jgi:CMP-N-acetylneuraminic acid synthetase
MYKGKTIFALIPARSGSKGIKDKNIKDLCGKPLIGRAIESALGTGLMDAIIVSTDSSKYADIARDYGAEVPFFRPRNIADDTSLASEYIVHALETLKAAERNYDYFVLLQPTSPLRTVAQMITGIKMIVDENLDAVVAFSESESPMESYRHLPPDMRLNDFAVMKEANRQDYKPCYRVNGMFYACRVDKYLKTHNFYGPNSKAFIVDRIYALDIDDEYDFALAEFLISRGIGN